MSIISSMLSMIDPDNHHVIINDEIGLLWNSNKYGKSFNIRTDYFTIIGPLGSILFDERIVEVGKIFNASQEIDSYIFVLKDYDVEDSLNDFFGFSKEKCAIILYNPSSKSLYTNCKELSSKYKLIQLEYTKSHLYYNKNNYNKVISNKLFNISNLIPA